MSAPQTVVGMDCTKVAELACGGAHVLAVADGVVWAWGRGDSGQLGIVDKPEVGYCEMTPLKVSLPPGTAPATAISCGSHHCLVLTSDNDIFSWGYGDNLALGQGKERDENRPTKLDKSKYGGGAKVLQLGGGAQHSAILLSS